jgi:hypothetical protein
MVDAIDAELMALLEEKRQAGGKLSPAQQKLLDSYRLEFLVTEKSPFDNPLDEAGARFALSSIKPIRGAQQKYLENKFGAENVMERDGAFFARPEGQDQFFAIDPKPPIEDREGMVEGTLGILKDAFVQNPDFLAEIVELYPTLARGAAVLGGSIGGTIAGATKGRPIAGGAAGSALGTALGDIGAAGVAATQDALPEDIGGQAIVTALKSGAVAAGDLLTGGMLKAITNIPGVKAIATKAMKVAGKSADEIGGVFNDLKKQYIDKSFAKKLERLKVSDDKVLKAKYATQEAEELTKLQKELGDYIPGMATSKTTALTKMGELTKKAVATEVDKIDSLAQQSFKAGDNYFLNKARAGTLNQGDFADTTLFVKQMEGEIDSLLSNEAIAANPQATKSLQAMLGNFKKILNDTIKNAPRETKAKLGMRKFIGSPTKRDPLGMLIQEPSIKKTVEFEFDPKLVTGRDLRELRNHFTDTINNLDTYTDIPKAQVKKLLVRAKAQVDDALSPGLDLQQTLGGVLSGAKNETLEEGIQYSKGLIKAPKTKGFMTYNKGYKTLSDGFKKVNNNIRSKTLKTTDDAGFKVEVEPSDVQSNVLGMNLEDARAVKNLAMENLSTPEKAVFNKTVRAQYLQKGARPEAFPDIKPTEASKAASKAITPDDLKAQQMAGQKISRSEITHTIGKTIDPGDETIPRIAAGSAEQLGAKSKALTGLTEGTQEQVVDETLGKLSKLQELRGLKSSFQDMTASLPIARQAAGTFGGAPAAYGAGTAGQFLQTNLGRGAAIASPVISALESIPGGTLTQLGLDSLLGGDVGSPSEEQRKLYRLKAEKARLLD